MKFALISWVVLTNGNSYKWNLPYKHLGWTWQSLSRQIEVFRFPLHHKSTQASGFTSICFSMAKKDKVFTLQLSYYSSEYINSDKR